MRALFVVLALLSAPMALAQDCVDPTAPADDCDEDGFSTAEDDCDDEDASVFPGAREICGDGIDNNCNARIDDDCAFQDGELSGGSGCGADNGWAVLFLPVLLVARRRR